MNDVGIFPCVLASNHWQKCAPAKAGPVITYVHVCPTSVFCLFVHTVHMYVFCCTYIPIIIYNYHFQGIPLQLQFLTLSTTSGVREIFVAAADEGASVSILQPGEFRVFGQSYAAFCVRM